MDNKKPQQVQLLSKPPALAVDGNNIFIADQGYSDITFLQVVNRTEETVQVIGVASVRLPIDQLKAFNDSLTKAIKDFEEKKSKQAQKDEKEKTSTKR